MLEGDFSKYSDSHSELESLYQADKVESLNLTFHGDPLGLANLS